MEDEYDSKRWLFLLKLIKIMAKFKPKKIIRDVKEFYKNNPTAKITTATAGFSGTNLAINATGKNSDKKYQEEQLEAMDKLTKALGGVNKTLKEVKEPKKTTSYKFKKIFSEKNDNNMITFRRKDFSILSDTVKGAIIGGNVATLSLPLSGKDAKNIKYEGSNPTFRKLNTLSPFAKRLGVVAAGTLVGAALGALVGTIKKGDEAISRKLTVDNRLMDRVVEDLKKTGFKEGSDFTRDPKTADSLKSAISVAITRNSGELRLLVNTIADNKLKDITKNIIRNLPNSSAVTEESKSRYNEISITTISDGTADVGLIAGICEKFIRNKYPVYLVEVG